MRGLFTDICFFLFFIAAPLAIFSFIINSTLTPGYIKGKLQESKIYTAAADSVPHLVVLPEDVAAQMPSQVKELKAFLVKEITASYLQTKTENTIDSTYGWLTGKSESPPTVDLVDLKGKVEDFAQGEGLSLSPDIEKNFSKPIEIIKPDQNASKIRSGFKLFQKAPLILGVLSGAILLAIFLLAGGWKSKLRKLSLVVFVPSTFWLIVSLVIHFFWQHNINMIISTILSTIAFSATKAPVGVPFPFPKDALFAPLNEPVRNLFLAVPNGIAKVTFIAFGIALLVSVVLFLASFFVGKKLKEPPEIPVQTETPQTSYPQSPSS